MGLPVAALLPGGQPVVLRAATRSDVCALVELFADDELGAARDGRQLARADRSSAGRRRPARTGSGPADPEAADLRRRSTAASAQPTNTHNAAAARRANDFAAAAAAAGAHVLYTRQILDLDRLTPRQRRWERPGGLCAAGSWGAELFLDPVPGSTVITKHRFDCWQSEEFSRYLDAHDVDGLVITGVELVCCVLYAVLGASERGYHYVIPDDLVSGQDPGDDTDNRAVRDYLRYNRPAQLVPTAEPILDAWHRTQPTTVQPQA